MKLIWEEDNQVVAERLRIAKNFFERLTGLLTTRSFVPGDALWIPKCKGIHTFGMRFPIDIVFLSEKSEVILAIPDIPPGRTSPVVLKAASVIEFPAGTLKRCGISAGSRFKIGG